MLLSLGRGLAPAGRGQGVELPSAPAPFTGLLDGLEAAPLAAYSTRRLSGAYAGPCLRLRRASDDAEQDFGFDPAGALDSAAIAAWLAGAAGHVAAWYDQSGHAADLAQASAGRQPLIETAAIAGLPALRFVKAAENFLERPAFPELNQTDPPWSSFFVHRHAVGAAGSGDTMWTQANETVELTYLTVRPRHGSQDWASIRIRPREADSEVGAQESSPAAFADIDAHQSSVICVGTNVTWRKDQVAIPGLNGASMNAVSALASTRFTLGCFNRTTSVESLFLGADLTEIMIFDSAVSSSDQDAIEDDQIALWEI
ncbi:MAG: arabinofuranosidase catalytic domain-containing protein [Rhodovibrionaceae bacterium]